MSFYHITTKSSAEKILREGLKPRGLTRRRTLYGANTPSVPSYCYLCTTDKMARSVTSCLRYETKEALVELRIKEELLDKKLLRPDEDWIADRFLNRLLVLLDDLAYMQMDVPLAQALEPILDWAPSALDHIRFESQGTGVVVDGIRVAKPIIEAAYKNIIYCNAYKATRVIDLFGFLWQDCADMGTVAYKGIVPANAIETSI